MQRRSERRWWIVALATACGAPAPTAESTSTTAGNEMTGSPSDPGAPSAPVAMPGSMPAGSPSAAPPVVEAPLPMDVMLDDFEDGDGEVTGEGVAGRWRTYSDGTGTVTPLPGEPIVVTEGAVHVAGSNFSTWGVGLAVDLDLSTEERRPVDLGAYRGLTIVAKGTGSIDVELVLPATTGTAESGGTCTAESGCFGHYSATLTLGADYEGHTLAFSEFQQPDWALAAPLDVGGVLAINFLSRANGGPVGIDLWVDSVALAAPLPVSTPGAVAPGVATVADGSNPFAGRTLHSEGGAALSAYQGAGGADRDLLAKVALNPSAYWLVGGDPGRAGALVSEGGDQYTVLVAYNIPDRDCNGESQGGAGSEGEYQGWIDGISSSLAGKQAAVILEPDALALSCGESTERLISYAVDSLRQNPGVAVYIDGGHSNWVAAGEMANRLRAAGIERATGFAVNVSNFQPTDALINYGRGLSGLLGGKPFVIDTSRNGRGARGAEWCNPAGAGLGEAPTTTTGDEAVHAFLWVKRPGESDGSCGQCTGTPAGQFCTGYALELARNAVF